MNKGIVIVGFAGIGKTTLAKKYKYDIVLVWIHPEEILTDYDINDIDYYLYFPVLPLIFCL